MKSHFSSVLIYSIKAADNWIKHILYVVALIAAFSAHNLYALSFDETLDDLSNYEKEIVRADELDKMRIIEIREALIEIQNESSTALKELENDLTTKRERLNALLEQPASSELSEDETSATIDVVDQTLLRSTEELKLNLIVLRTESKKATLVNVYANELLVELAEATSEQSQKLLFNRAPSLLALSNWQTAYKSIPGVLQRISNDILTWVAMMLAIGFVAIFGLGPILYRQYQSGYENFMPTRNYPKWSFLLIFALVLIANCVYFVFISQDEYLELTFIILMLLNISLAIVLLKRLNDVEFVPLQVFIDGESVQQDRQIFVFFISLIKLLTIASIIASVSGYLVLSMYTLHNIVITLTAILLFLSLRSLWIDSELKIVNASASESEKKTTGSIFLLTVVELLLAVGLFLAAARFWGVSLNNFEGQSRILRGEFQVGSLTLEFNQMLASVFAFVIVFYFFKLVRWFLRERLFKTIKVSVAASEAVVAVVGYIGFTFAIVASLNALGVQSENLAIVAGALSVGIGFGLQTIFSNFVSGLIILFERPVRVGDWVILGNGLEGHIKKVNMRSTEVMTLERSSVLIPNSNLLSDTITNWTLNDNIGRQDINVGVAYGSDTQQVEEVLLQVAAEHPKLRRYPIPRVLFRDFGESSLDLTLRFFLVNINDRHQVASDLRFSIDKAFRENDITIPFPQHDVHVKPSSSKES